MAMNVEIGELSIVIAAHNHNPTLLNPDFLKYNGIVPMDWAPAVNPVCTDVAAQVAYPNGVSITAQLGKVVISQPVLNGELDRLSVPEIASKYVTVLPHVGYEAVGINPTAHLPLESEQVARDFMLSHMFRPGKWRQFREEEPLTSCRLRYPLPTGHIMLSMEIARRQDESTHAIIFGGNFHHQVMGQTTIEKMQQLKAAVETWRTDIAVFKDLIRLICEPCEGKA